MIAKLRYAAVIIQGGTARALTATVDEWSNPDYQQAVVALKPYGWHDPVLYIIPRDGVGDYAMYRVSGCGMWMVIEGLRVRSIWTSWGPVTAAHHNYDALRCYLSGIRMSEIGFAPPNVLDYRDAAVYPNLINAEPADATTI